ncbi:MAG: adenylosuccinate synthase [archaeon]
MSSVFVIGAQFGDEGKGKLVDCLAEKSDCVVRFQGGNNAGHTVVVNENIFKLHLLPSGVIRNKRSLIGAGVSLDPRVLKEEINELKEKGIEVNLGIDPRCQIIMPWHNIIDIGKEEALKEKNIGTTRRGVGPCYADRASRIGIRFDDLIDEKRLKEKLSFNFFYYQELCELVLGKKFDFTVEEVFEEYSVLGAEFEKFLSDVSIEVNLLLDKKKKVLFEGAQGTMLDNDFGTYPFVTSSHPMSGAATIGVGISPKKIEYVVGVVKAYTTRVGSGPFPTELFEDEADFLRNAGNEFGTTTGRARRVGWLDLPMLRLSHRLNGFDEIAITKLDVLSGLKTLLVAESYSIDGKKVFEFPYANHLVEKAEPNYTELKGFTFEEKEREKLRKNGFTAMPSNAKKYLSFIEKQLKVPVKTVSFGAERNDTVTKGKLLC